MTSNVGSIVAHAVVGAVVGGITGYGIGKAVSTYSQTAAKKAILGRLADDPKYARQLQDYTTKTTNERKSAFASWLK